jgi:hypothetical protein
VSRLARSMYACGRADHALSRSDWRTICRLLEVIEETRSSADNPHSRSKRFWAGCNSSLSRLKAEAIIHSLHKLGTSRETPIRPSRIGQNDLKQEQRSDQKERLLHDEEAAFHSVSW